MAVIDVYVTDVVDHTPVFDHSPYSIHVPENMAVNSTIVSLHASTTDKAPLDALKYYLVMSNDSDDDNVMFEVGVSSGELVLVVELDYEERAELILWVQVHPLTRPELLAEVLVNIHVTNVNDHSPMFSRAIHEVSVMKVWPEGSYVTMVTADDADRGLFGEITYSFAPNVDSSISANFDLDSSTGLISTSLSLQNEMRNNFTLVIVGTDGGSPPHSSKATVYVSVIDTENTPPVFLFQHYTAEVPEGNFILPMFVINLTLGNNVVAGSEDRYFIQSGDVEGLFNVSSEGGVSMQGSLDREARSSYNLVVVVMRIWGMGGEWGEEILEGSTCLHVDVLDVNDEAPRFLNSFYTITISEDVTEGEELVRVIAEDRDRGLNGQVTYSLKTSIDIPFLINRESGVIMLGALQTLDYEAAHNLSVVVVATDGGEALPLSSSTLVVFHILDVNDNAPTFTEFPPRVCVEENTSMASIVQVTATDADSGINSLVHYEMTGDLSSLLAFRVTSSGQVYTIGGLDRETRDTYHLTILATDNGTPPLSSSVSLIVDVADVIDDPPMFLQSRYYLHIASRRPINSILTNVAASTRDLSVPSSSICYSMASSEGFPFLFEVDRHGDIRAAMELLPDVHTGQYVLVVTAEYHTLSSSITIDVTISSSEEAPSMSSLTIYFISFLTSLQPSTPMATLSVECPTDTPLTFSLLPSLSTGISRHFNLHPSSGLLTVRSSVNSGRHLLNVSISSHTNMSVASVRVYVTILTNSTLDNTVGIIFGGVSMEQFLSVHLQTYLLFVAEVVGTSQDNVEVCGMQPFIHKDYNDGVELALAVRSHDITHGYVVPDILRSLLLTHVKKAPLRFDISPITCNRNSCRHLQTCQSLMELHQLQTFLTGDFPLVVPGLVYHSSHSFSHTHRCMCPPGYSRHDLCATEIDECSGQGPCLLGSECVDLVADYLCLCPTSATDKNCSTICPSSSCHPCIPNPCKYGGLCFHLSGSSPHHVCRRCPWGVHSGPHCELLTATFTPGAFLTLPTPSSTTRFSVSLSFATISSSCLLLHAARHDVGADHVTVEVLVGQVRVSVSFGGVATILDTDSEERLNDGAWHRVVVEIRDRVRKGCGL